MPEEKKKEKKLAGKYKQLHSSFGHWKEKKCTRMHGKSVRRPLKMVGGS